MIEIKPTLRYQEGCPYCQKPLTPTNTLWHGLHICVESTCSGCEAELVEQLKTGHTIVGGCQFDLNTSQVFGDEWVKAWFGETLLHALKNPEDKPVEVVKEVLQPHQRVIILNCIDYLYGHSVLKLLNAQRHLEQHKDYGLIVIVPKFLRWMVPKDVAEIWTVNIPLKQGQKYFPQFNQFMQKELERFEEVQVSEAYSHPSRFDIAQFTGVSKHDFAQQQFNITFIWREDRPWCSHWLYRVLKKLNFLDLALVLQNWKIRKLMSQLKAKVPDANFVIAGLGRKTQFSGWIEDFRVDVFDQNTERQLCKIYSDSRLIIGVHGSNMLLPSGHAGMTIDLMPDDRWGNFAQDILYQETDPRLASYRYRYLPAQTKTRKLAEIAAAMLLGFDQFRQSMVSDKEL